MAAVSAILKKNVQIFWNQTFFMFLGPENMILTLFFKSEFKYSLSCQIKDFITFFNVKIGIFLKITVKRTQIVIVYQNFGYNMFV